MLDSIIFIPLIQAAVDEVSAAMGQLRKVAIWEKDAFGKTIQVPESGFFVFQLKGHMWTAIQRFGWHGRPRHQLSEQDVQTLSHLLKTKVVLYTANDHMGRCGYTLYDNGSLLEELTPVEDNSGWFQSSLHPSEKEWVEDAYTVTEKFLYDYEIYVPLIDFEAMDHVLDLSKATSCSGNRGEVDLQRSDFERLDYIAW